MRGIYRVCAKTYIKISPFFKFDLIKYLCCLYGGGTEIIMKVTLQSESNLKKLASIFAVAGNIIFGFSILFTKIAYTGTDVSVSVMLMWRFIITCTALFSVLAFSRKSNMFRVSFRGKRISRLVLLGIIEPILYFIFENSGLRASGATMGAVILALIPILAVIIGAIVLSDRPSLLQVLFSYVSMIGVIVISIRQNGTQQNNSVFGIICLCVAALLSATFFVMSKKLSTEFSPFEKTLGMFAVGTVFFTAWALIENRHSLISLFLPWTSTRFVISIIYLSLFSSAVAYMMINFAASHLSVSRFSSFSNIQSVISVFSSMIFIDNSYDIYTILAAALTVFGVWGVQHFDKSQKDN